MRGTWNEQSRISRGGLCGEPGMNRAGRNEVLFGERKKRRCVRGTWNKQSRISRGGLCGEPGMNRAGRNEVLFGERKKRRSDRKSVV